MTANELYEKQNEIMKKRWALFEELEKTRQEEVHIEKVYMEENAKFKVGDTVQYLKEKFKTPRKYIVQDINGFFKGPNHYQIYYHIATKNGHKANGGWGVDEEELAPHPMAV